VVSLARLQRKKKGENALKAEDVEGNEGQHWHRNAYRRERTHEEW
jgi:hypothetical protein